MSQKPFNIIGKSDKINVKNFESLEEFNDYYKLHEKEINELSTVKLNKMFKIKDFKIVRRKQPDNTEEKALYFQQVFKKEEPKLNLESRIEELGQTMNILNEKVKIIETEQLKIKSQLLEIIKVINTN